MKSTVRTPLKHGPDFICIGPEKSGTSWLYALLSTHPDVWLPPVKELRYFNEGYSNPVWGIARGGGLLSLNFKNHYIREAWLSLGASLRRMLNEGGYGRFCWTLHYVLGVHSPRWYCSLFEAAGARLTGDVTPLYYHLPEEAVARVASIVPHAKIIIMPRNPIDRAWSKAVMNTCRHKGRRVEDVTESELIDALELIRQNWEPYDIICARWRRYFSNVQVFCYDHLLTDPIGLSRSICEFLSISDEFQHFDFSARVNAGLKLQRSDRINNLLQAHYAAEMEQFQCMCQLP